MGPLWYALRAGLRAEWRRAAGVALIVAVAGAAVLTLTAGVFRTSSAPDRYSASLGGDYDVSLEQFAGRPRRAAVEALPAVAAVETATFVFAGLIDADKTPIEGFVFAGSERAFGARILDGRAPSAATEFVATRSWLAAAGAEIGDRFRLLMISQEEADARGFDVADPAGPALEAKLVGVMHGANELQENYPLTLFPPALLGAGDVGVASTVGVVALVEGATVADLRTQLDGLSGTSFGLEPAEWVSDDVRAAVSAQGQGLAVVASIVGAAAIAVLGQLLARRTQRRPSHRLILRSMGLTPLQLGAEPIGTAAVPVVAGSVAAGGLAYLASGLFPTGFTARVEPDAGLRVDPWVHVVGPVILAAALLGWVVLSQRIGDRAARRRAAGGGSSTLIGRLGPGPAATGLRFAVTRPAGEASARTSVTGLVVVSIALVASITFGASLDRFLDDPARYGSNFDFATGAGGDVVPDELLDLLEDDPDVTDLTLYGTQLASVGPSSFDVTGMDPRRGSLAPEVLAGRLPRRADEIVLGGVASRQFDAGVGDELVVTGSDGPVRFSVTGIAVIPAVEGGDGLGEGGVTTLAGLRRVSPDAAPSVAAVRGRAEASGVAKRIRDSLGIEVGRPDPPPTVLNMDRVRSTPYLVAGSLAALSLLSIGHQLLSAARRRRRDMAVLRALGADRRWITGVLHWHAMVVAAATVVVAAPIGVAAGRVVYRAFIDRVGARTDGSVPLLVLAAAFGGLLAAVNLVAAVPARRARRDVPGRVLAGE